MSTRIRFTKDWNDHSKGEVVTLRSREAKDAIKARVAVVQSDLSSESYQTKESSDGNTKNLRAHNRRRR